VTLVMAQKLQFVLENTQVTIALGHCRKN